MQPRKATMKSREGKKTSRTRSPGRRRPAAAPLWAGEGELVRRRHRLPPPPCGVILLCDYWQGRDTRMNTRDIVDVD